MLHVNKSILVFLSCFCIAAAAFSQSADNIIFSKDSQQLKNLTISYSIETKSEKNPGVDETYNGGLKTLFVSDSKIRVRLVSLMRMQSLFVLPQLKNSSRIATVVRESGKDKYKFDLNARQWAMYNKKYDSAVCKLLNDSIDVLGYACRKAEIMLKDGRVLTVFYTNQISNAVFSSADAALSSVPGIVLKYSYQHQKGTITYTATHVTDAPIDKSVFKIPITGYKVKRYVPGRKAGSVDELLKDEVEEPDEEDAL